MRSLFPESTAHSEHPCASPPEPHSAECRFPRPSPAQPRVASAPRPFLPCTSANTLTTSLSPPSVQTPFTSVSGSQAPSVRKPLVPAVWSSLLGRHLLYPQVPPRRGVGHNLSGLAWHGLLLLRAPEFMFPAYTPCDPRFLTALPSPQVQSELKRKWRGWCPSRPCGRDYRLHSLSVSRNGSESALRLHRGSRTPSSLQTETSVI